VLSYALTDICIKQLQEYCWEEMWGMVSKTGQPRVNFKQNEKRNGVSTLQECTAFINNSHETTILEIGFKFHKPVKTKKFSSYITFGKE
jgi:hypothetical protein